jgi:hypothetical protein
MIAFGVIKINGNWMWSRSFNPFDKIVLGWISTPTTDGDCAGFSGNTSFIKNVAVTFPCTEVKRVICE